MQKPQKHPPCFHTENAHEESKKVVLNLSMSSLREANSRANDDLY